VATEEPKVPGQVEEAAKVAMMKTCKATKTFSLTYAGITVSCGRVEGHESWAPVHMAQMTVETMPPGAKKATGSGTIVLHWE